VGTKLNRGQGCGDRPYQQLIGSLNFLAVCTRPDITYTVNYLSRFNNCHEEEHWIAAKRVLRYLKGTINVCLKYQKSDSNIKGYADADFAGDEDDRKSCTGFTFIMGDGAITWESKKQTLVAMSTSESEYIALSEACKEAKYLQNLLYEILDKKVCINVFNYNQSAQAWAHYQMPYSRTK
ncbi:hypothetical protein KPH14_012684, partial [Odynerus spinipes]